MEQAEIMPVLVSQPASSYVNYLEALRAALGDKREMESRRRSSPPAHNCAAKVKIYKLFLFYCSEIHKNGYYNSVVLNTFIVGNSYNHPCLEIFILQN